MKPKSPTMFSPGVKPIAMVLFLLGTVAVLHADGPAWWSSRGVFKVDAVANDYAPVNQGQLKNIASKAYDEIVAHLPNGAGTTTAGLALTAKYNSLSTVGVATDDYAAVSLGQLKFLAQPYYDRLIEAGYTNSYPWKGTAEANDKALANIGQVKNLFSFDLVTSSTGGIPDWWILHYFGSLTAPNSGSSDSWNHDGTSNWAHWSAHTDPTAHYGSATVNTEAVGGPVVALEVFTRLE